MQTAQKKINRYSGFEKKKFPFIYLFIAFPVAQFLVFWLYVNFSSIVLAFQDGEGVPTLENFKMIFQAMFKAQGYNESLPLFNTMMRSLFLWGLDFFILFPIGVTTTYILYRQLPGHYVFRLCYIIPSLMGAVVWSKLIIYIVGSHGLVVNFLYDNGWIAKKLVKVGLFGTEDTAFPTIVSIKILMGLVGNNAVLTGAFTRVPDEIYESAELDGAGFWRTYINIAVPCVWSTIATLMTFSLCSFITADYNVFLFTGGSGAHETSTVGFLLYKITYTISNSTVSGDPYYGYPAALGVFFTCITLPIVLIGRKLIDKIFADVEV